VAHDAYYSSLTPLLSLFQETETAHRRSHLFNAFFRAGTSTHHPRRNAKARSFSLDRRGAFLLFNFLAFDFRKRNMKFKRYGTKTTDMT